MIEVLVVLAAAFGIPLVWGIVLYNGLVRVRQMVMEGWSGIDVQLKRRANLIPNLIETVKGYLTIDEDDGEFTLRCDDDDQTALSSGERKIAMALFTNATEVKLHHTNHVMINFAVVAFKQYLRAEFSKIHFRLNRVYFAVGAVISVIALFTLAMGEKDPAGAASMMVFLSVWTGGCAFFAASVGQSWRRGEVAKAVGQSLSPFPPSAVRSLACGCPWRRYRWQVASCWW